MSQALFEEIAGNYKRCTDEYKNPMLFPAMVCEQVGLCDKDGNRFFGPAGGPSLITPASAQGTPVLQPQYQHQQVVIAGWADATGKVYSVAAGAAGGGVPVWVTNR